LTILATKQIMKKLIILLFTANLAFAQTTPKRIKIILLGTFHMNQSLDSNSRLHSNLFTPKRQNEVNELVAKLLKQKPDKIFCEFTPKNQARFDSIYTDYLAGIEPLKRSVKANEIFQLAMKAAKILGHKKVIGMNYQPLDMLDDGYKPKNIIDSLNREFLMALSKFEDESRTNTPFYDLPFPQKLGKQDSVLQKSTLTEFYRFINKPIKLQQSDYYEWNSALSYGTGEVMTNADYIGQYWYGTNLKNYNNVLRQVDYKSDKTYLVIYGSNHIPFLNYLFGMNPYFEVVDIEKVLK
jgi:Family of unknown function (DUF5694)